VFRNTLPGKPKILNGDWRNIIVGKHHFSLPVFYVILQKNADTSGSERDMLSAFTAYM
jgi:hypothetical protein